MNKRLLTLFTFCFLLITCVCAQVPQGMKYQAVARNKSGAVLQHHKVGLRFTIRDGSINGSIVYSEAQTDSTNEFGLFTVVIGNGTPQVGNFNTIAWGSGSKFLQIELDTNGGTNYTNLGGSQLMSVPYALSAEKVTNPQYQTLKISNDTLFLTNGGFVKLPSAALLGGVSMPKLTTAAATQVTSNTAIVKAALSTPSSNIVEWGICYDTKPNPTVSDLKFACTAGNAFTLHLSGDSAYLKSGTVYYARAYAITENNIHAYGNEINFKTLTVGQTGTAGGRVIFDKGFYSNGWRYIESDTNMIPDHWGCWNTLVGKTSDSLGAGKGNTDSILTVCPYANAALGCSNFVSGSKSDWFLPSKEEAMAYINWGVYSPGNILWTSSEISSTQVWVYDISTGKLIPYNKSSSVFSYYTPIRRY
ncbi:MAG: hypothetical protein V4613_08320 [Bacteroidota bacterium]